MINALVLITVDPASIAELGASIAALDGVREVHSVAAANVDLVALLSVADHEGVADLVTTRIAQLDGILTTQTMIAFRSFSAADVGDALGDF